MSESRRAVFLDRDGVLNRSFVRDGKPYAPRCLADFRLLPRVGHAVQRLKDVGFMVVVVTNQPDIGNGFVDPAAVAAMNDLLMARVAVDEVLVCPHKQTEGCDCRKPRPGMLLEAAKRHGLNLSASFMVGDRGGDIVAGLRAGCYTLLVQRGYAELLLERPHVVVPSLPAAVTVILERFNQGY